MFCLWSIFPQKYCLRSILKENYRQATVIFFFLTHMIDSGNIHSTYKLEMFLFGEIFA